MGQFAQMRGQRFQQLYARSGYFVFFPNFRGSYLGKSSQMLFRRCGIDDARDVREAVGALRRKYPLSAKAGLIGHSYGGYLAATLAYERTFSAVVVRNGAFDRHALLPASFVGRGMNTEYFGFTTATEAEQLKTFSPMYRDGKVTAPVLLMHGEKDFLPVEATRAFERKLRDAGTDVSLVVYPGEGHSLSKPQNMQDMFERLLGFFDKHLN